MTWVFLPGTPPNATNSSSVFGLHIPRSCVRADHLVHAVDDVRQTMCAAPRLYDVRDELT